MEISQNFVAFSEYMNFTTRYIIIFPIRAMIHDLDNMKSTLLNIKRKLYSCWRCSNNYVSSHFDSWNPCTVIRIALKITRLCLHKKILLKWGESLRPWIDNNFPSVWSSPLRLLDTCISNLDNNSNKCQSLVIQAKPVSEYQNNLVIEFLMAKN